MKSSFAGWMALALAAGLGAPQAGAFEFPKIGLPSVFGGSRDAPPAPGATADCPVIVVDDGSHMLRSPPGAEASAVHHQVSIKSTARDCVVDGSQLIIRVGVEGDAMLGPAGSPGSYGGTIRVALRRIKDESILSSKNYRVNATIPAGAARADFHLLADPMTAPSTAKAQDEYEILVGFTEGTESGGEKSAGKSKKGRR